MEVFAYLFCLKSAFLSVWEVNMHKPWNHRVRLPGVGKLPNAVPAADRHREVVGHFKVPPHKHSIRPMHFHQYT